ncbi:hypothetical protein MJD09_17885, partial [bacterium]|nr:hypothetical protein [bacterium]
LTGTLTLFGPRSPELLATLFDADFENLADRHFQELSWQEQTLTISRTEELGLAGFDLTVVRKLLPELWDLLSSDANRNMTPMGEDAYKILRVEAGWPLPGHDYDEALNPHEAGMDDFLDYDKGCYIGQEVIARLDTYEKVQKQLVGIIVEGDTSLVESCKIVIDDNEIGHLTSVTRSPSLDRTIALGYVGSKYLESARNVSIVNNNQRLPGQIVDLPFEIPE